MAQRLVFLLFGLFFLIADASAWQSRHRFPRRIRQDLETFDTTYHYETRFFTNEADHFSFRPKSYRTFQQKYLLNDTFWDRKKGPIFFYAGNEGAIEWFTTNTGFMWELAEEQNALLVFAEHRFYGDSMPSKDHLFLLTAEQALADYAVLLTSLKSNLSIPHTPVIAFGGSYGGMLAAWMRLKYPHIIAGAVASSAPILWFEDLTPVDSFERIVTDNFRAASQSCVDAINASWTAIDDLANKPNGKTALGEIFGVCKQPEAGEVKGWLASAFANIAMVNYPYPTNFLAPLPAHPIAHMCRLVDDHQGSLLHKVAAGANLFYNYSGQVPQCYDLGADPNGEDNWGFQYCTQMTMPMESNPDTSMFPPTKWNLTEVSEDCEQHYNVTPRPEWIITEFGGRRMATYLKHFGSNIVFAAGNLDPWTAGCVTTQLNERLPVILIQGGAHHLDLRSAHKDDPRSVIAARNEEARLVRAWVTDAFHHAHKDPDFPKHRKASGFTYGLVIMVFCISLFGIATVLLVEGPERSRIMLG